MSEDKPMQPQIVEKDGERFVKVRIPVMVDSDGRWYGAADYSEGKKRSEAGVVETAFGLGFDHAMHMRWLYALVPVPEPDDFVIVDAEVSVSAPGKEGKT